MNKNVLIITYYWPPASGPGVQRVLKFTKYLSKIGWKPVILTVQNGEYPATDPSLLNEIPAGIPVYKTKIFEPTVFYKKIAGLPQHQPIPVAVLSEESKGLGKKIGNWIRANIFIPDAKVGLALSRLHFAAQIIQEHNIGIIFSSSPPPSVHLLASRIARKFQLPWVADFRDPWTNIHYYQHVHRCGLSKKIDEKLETSVLNKASAITSVSKSDLENDFKSKRHNKQNMFYLPNGFDPEDFSEILEQKMDFPSKFVLTHIGIIGKERIPYRFIEFLGEKILENPEVKQSLELRFIGKISDEMVDLLKDADLWNNTQYPGYLSHKEAIRQSMESYALLLLITNVKGNEGIVPGKVFEYMAYRKPIISFGHPEGEVSQILQAYQNQGCFDYNLPYESFNTYFDKLFHAWQNKKPFNPDISVLQRYSREHLTGELISIFNSLLHAQ
ncbi:MAG: glycosyltransferase family 4 protein [Calditrichia bacterium]